MPSGFAPLGAPPLGSHDDRGASAASARCGPSAKEKERSPFHAVSERAASGWRCASSAAGSTATQEMEQRSQRRAGHAAAGPSGGGADHPGRASARRQRVSDSGAAGRRDAGQPAERGRGLHQNELLRLGRQIATVRSRGARPRRHRALRPEFAACAGPRGGRRRTGQDH